MSVLTLRASSRLLRAVPRQQTTRTRRCPTRTTTNSLRPTRPSLKIQTSVTTKIYKFKIPILNLSCFLTISRAQDPVQSRNSWRHRRRQVAAWSTPSVIWVKRSDSQWRGSSLRRSQCSQLPPSRSNARLLNTNNTRFVRFELTEEVMSTAGGALGNFFASFESRTLDCLRCHREAGITDSNWGRMLPSCSHVFTEQDAMEASEQNVREASEKQGENWELLRMERVKISLNQDARWRRIWH